jgi:hypothetical protein
LGLPAPPAPAPDEPVISAALHMAPAEPAAPVTPAATPAAAKPRPGTRARHTPSAALPAAASAAAGAGPAASAPDDATPVAAAQDGAAGASADVQSAPVLAEADEPVPPPAPASAPAPPPGAPRVYKASIPPPAELSMSVLRTDADGAVWHGEAVIAWKLDGGAYTMRVEAGIRVVFARVNLVVLGSEGAVGDAGFMPLTMTEKRRGRSQTATHFNRQDGRITFSASPASYQLVGGAQDKATVPLQLAAIARADPGQLDGGIEIMVGEDKDASVFRFVVLGQEELDTPLGKMQTWHLSRPPRPGAYGSRLDIWLAPEHDWYPVQIRNAEANGALTTQTISKIVLKGPAS